MLRGRFESAGQLSPEELHSRYVDLLAETVEAVGIERVAEQSGIDRESTEHLADGVDPELTVEAAATILATDGELPDADTIEAEARDILLIGMSVAVLDVEALASAVDGELEPGEIQGKVEGRYPMTLDEYALVHQRIESEKP